MTSHLNGSRILIYSHDTFGLGHLRRCQTIAHALVEQYKGLSILILSGSPIIGSFDYRARVDFVRIPGVIKLYNGDYTSLGLHIDLKETLAIRASIIEHTAAIFDPDLFLVDKEPLGLQSEIRDTLTMLKDRGTSLVVGLRDIMDEPLLLRKEWEKRNVIPVLENLYDEIWVYGLPQICDPLGGIDVPPSVRDKMIYTGYLPRMVPKAAKMAPAVRMDEPYVLVTAGGGGDGPQLMDWVLRAYETDTTLPHGALLVLGPFMPSEAQREILERADRLNRVNAITFDAHMEILMAESEGMVAMGGYNTFCEILSFDKRAVIVPRTRPREEQLIRASRAQDLGLAKLLMPDLIGDVGAMIEALHALPHQKKPSDSMPSDMLDGLVNVGRFVEKRVKTRRRRERLRVYG